MTVDTGESWNVSKTADVILDKHETFKKTADILLENHVIGESFKHLKNSWYYTGESCDRGLN